MSPFNLPEFDPSLQEPSRLHVIIRVPEKISEDFSALIKEKFQGLKILYDKDAGRLLVIVEKECEAGQFLPQLADTIHEFIDTGAEGEPEIVETRMAVPEADRSEASGNFSRFISIDGDTQGEDRKKFSLRMTGATVFGSGTHPSTRLAVLALEHLYTNGDFPSTVLDVGCGSGILSFSCCLFGARKVVGIDISPEAISVAKTNTRLNSLDGAATFSEQELSEIPGKFDLVIANVSAAVMSGMLDDFSRLVKKGGKLVLSGLQGRQQKEMADKMGALGFTVSGVYGQDQWRAMLLIACE